MSFRRSIVGGLCGLGRREAVTSCMRALFFVTCRVIVYKMDGQSELLFVVVASLQGARLAGARFARAEGGSKRVLRGAYSLDRDSPALTRSRPAFLSLLGAG